MVRQPWTKRDASSDPRYSRCFRGEGGEEIRSYRDIALGVYTPCCCPRAMKSRWGSASIPRMFTYGDRTGRDNRTSLSSGKFLRTSWFSGTPAKFPSKSIQLSLMVSPYSNRLNIRVFLMIVALLTPALGQIWWTMSCSATEIGQLLRPINMVTHIIRYSGVGHGFAVRPANASDPVQIAAKEKAFVEALKWVQKHL
jgi:hypothetical protein